MDVVTWCSSQFDKWLQLSRIGGRRVQSVQLFFALSVLSFSVFFCQIHLSVSFRGLCTLATLWLQSLSPAVSVSQSRLCKALQPEVIEFT